MVLETKERKKETKERKYIQEKLMIAQVKRELGYEH